jgi:hypothetical protein
MKVLFVLGGGIGNMIQATPAIQSIAQDGHIIDLNLFPDNANDVVDILKIPCVRQVFLQASDIDETYDYQLTGPFVGNYIKYRAKKYITTAKTIYKQAKPEAETYYHLALQMGIQSPMQCIKINSGAGECHHKDMVILYPGSKPDWYMKKWDKWDELAQHFSSVHVVGQEQDFSAPIWCHRTWIWPKHVSFITGNLQQIANHIAHCKVFIGNDGGLSHVAAATGVKTVVVFGPTNPIKNKPFAKNAKVCALDIPCRPCQWKSDWKELCRTGNCPYNIECLRGLSTEKVLSFI